MNIDTQLNEVFNLNPEEISTEVDVIPETPLIEIDAKDEVESDFKSARVILKNLIETNSTAIDQIGKIAITYENPRGFEVLGQLIKAQSELVKELLESHKKKKELVDKPQGKIEIENGIVFNGSTSELLKAITNRDNGK